MSDTKPELIFDHQCDDQVVATSKPCPRCGEVTLIAVSKARLEAHRAGTHAQVVWPHVAREHREILISGVHPACWFAMFGDLDE